MQFFKSVLNYKNGKFIYMILLTIIPSVVLSLCISPSTIIDFFCRYNKLDINGFASIATIFFNYKAGFIWYILGGILLTAVSLSLLFGAINRHMRVGEFTISFDLFFKRLNFNIITAIKFISVALIIVELGLFMIAVFTYAISLVLSMVSAWVASIIVMLIVGFLIFFAFSLIILWVPTILYTGLNSRKSFNLGVTKISKNLLKLTYNLSIPALPLFLVMVINSLLHLRLNMFLDIVLYITMINYYVIMMYTLFFELEGIERVDLKSVSIWRKSFRR